MLFDVYNSWIKKFDVQQIMYLPLNFIFVQLFNRRFKII
jgi:hypothetical protein